MPDSDATLAVVHAVFEAFDAHDLDRFRSLLAAGAILSANGGAQTVSGAEAVVEAVSLTFALLPDLRVTVTDAFACGDRGIAEVLREGTHSGPVPLPDGTVSPPTGRRVRLPECVVFEVHDGLVHRMSVYADTLDTARQLGLPLDGGAQESRSR